MSDTDQENSDNVVSIGMADAHSISNGLRLLREQIITAWTERAVLLSKEEQSDLLQQIQDTCQLLTDLTSHQVSEARSTAVPESHRRSFSAFRSAAEEAVTSSQAQAWDNEGGHMSSTAGRIVGTPDAALPYKAIMSLETGETTEHGFATMHEAEAFIRRNTPRPPARSTTYDHGPDEAAGDRRD